MAADPVPTEARVRQVVQELQSYHPLRVILFGSGARGACDEFSDLDFVVIKPSDEPWLDRMKDVALLCHAPGPIDFFVYTPQEWQGLLDTGSPFAERIMQEGRVVYEAEP